MIAAETLKFRVVLEILVEQIASDDQGFDAGRNRLGKDVLEGVVTFGVFCPSPEMCISRYCYFHIDLSLAFFPRDLAHTLYLSGDVSLGEEPAWTLASCSPTALKDMST